LSDNELDPVTAKGLELLLARGRCPSCRGELECDPGTFMMTVRCRPCKALGRYPRYYLTVLGEIALR